MIDEFADKGEVDIAWDFGRVYPVRIFMGLMGFPPAMFEQFLDWEWDILHSGSLEKMQCGAARRARLPARLHRREGEGARRASRPAPSSTARSRARPLTEDEKIGMVWFLWLGGLDTVAATISQMFRRMALQPEIQHQLRANPELINTRGRGVPAHPADPELGAAGRPRISSGTACRSRRATASPASTRRAISIPTRVQEPARVRSGAQGQPAFHLRRAASTCCLGAPLARRELRILLDEWFKRIPEFRVKPGADTTVFPGLLSIRNLPLVWDVP